ncbi:hypothetical protein GOODEAATRI_034106, partial [Goodea atripinnis]
MARIVPYGPPRTHDGPLTPPIRRLTNGRNVPKAARRGDVAPLSIRHAGALRSRKARTLPKGCMGCRPNGRHAAT